MKNNLFDNLYWVLKTKNKQPSDKTVFPFIFNRWLSMSSPDIANILNLTANRWLKNIKDFPIVDFYRSVLPKCNNKLTYIKKTPSSDVLDDIKHISNNMELSTKEIIFLEKALDNLKTHSK